MWLLKWSYDEDPFLPFFSSSGKQRNVASSPVAADHVQVRAAERRRHGREVLTPRGRYEGRVSAGEYTLF
jgi:hypothetical protein